MTDHESIDNAIVALAASPEGVCFAASQQGLRISRDGGATWQPAMPEAEGVAVTALALSPNFAEDRTIFAAIPGAIAHSIDAGKTWEFTGVPLPLQIISQFAISPDFANDQTIFAATTDDGILRSEDGGTSWQAWNFGLLDHNVLSLAISPDFANNRTLIAGTTTGLFSSANAGKSWRAIDLDHGFAEITALATLTDGTLFAVLDEETLYRSTNSGQMWNSIPVPADSIEAIATQNNSIAIAANNTIFTSDNCGTAWERRGAVENAVTALTFMSPNSLLIGTTSGTIFAITFIPSHHIQS